jgi:hypothetical protein
MQANNCKQTYRIILSPFRHWSRGGKYVLSVTVAIGDGLHPGQMWPGLEFSSKRQSAVRCGGNGVGGREKQPEPDLTWKLFGVLIDGLLELHPLH